MYCKRKHYLSWKLDETTYQILKKDEVKRGVTHYYCSKPCNKAAVKFLGSLWKIEQEVENLQANVMEVDTNVANIQEGNLLQIILEQNQEK